MTQTFKYVFHLVLVLVLGGSVAHAEFIHSSEYNERIDELQKEVDTFKATLQDKEYTINELRRRNEEVLDEAKSLKKEMSALEELAEATPRAPAVPADIQKLKKELKQVKAELRKREFEVRNFQRQQLSSINTPAPVMLQGDQALLDQIADLKNQVRALQKQPRYKIKDSNLGREVEELHLKVEELTEVKEKQLRRIDSLRASKTALEKRIKRGGVSNHSAIEVMEKEYQAEIHKLRRALVRIKKEKDSLIQDQAIYSAAQEAVTTGEAQIRALKEKIRAEQKSGEGQADLLREEIKQIQKRADEDKALVTALEMNLVELQNTKGELQQKVKALSGQLESKNMNFNEEVDQVNENLARTQNKLEKSEKNALMWQDMAEKLSDDLQSLQTEVAEAQTQVNASQTQIDEQESRFNSSLEDLKKSLEKKDAQIERLTLENETAQKNLAELESALLENKDLEEGQKSELTKSRAEVRILKNEQEALDDKIKELVQEKFDLLEASKKLEKQLAQTKSKVDILSKQKELQVNVRVGELEKSIASLEKEKADQLQSYKDLKKEKEAIAQELQLALKEKTNMFKRMSDYDSGREQMEAENQDLRKMIKIYKERQAGAQNSIGEGQVKALMKEHQAEMDVLRQKVLQKDEQLEQSEQRIAEVREKQLALKADVRLLSEQLREKERALAQAEKGSIALKEGSSTLSGDELEAVKAPLLKEIRDLNEQVISLEEQLRETWSSTQAIIREMKANEEAEELDQKIILEDLVTQEN